MMNWIWFSVTVVTSVVVLWILKALLFRFLKKWNPSTDKISGDDIQKVVSVPLNLAIILAALWMGGRLTQLPPDVKSLLPTLSKVALIIIAVIIADRLALLVYRRTAPVLRISASLVQSLLHALIYGMGGLIVLDAMGVSITPLLASLGIGSLAVALALQDTLANFFSGVYISIEQPLEVGHFVKLESGEEGYVEKIGWRSTRIRMLANNTVVVPNSKLAGSHFTNYYLPAKEMAVLVQVGVHYDSDLTHVERVTVEVAKETLQNTKGGLEQFDPFIRYHTFADSSINFTVILRAQEFVDQYLVKHEFIKRLHERYKKEGIIIPFPIRTLDFPPSIRASIESER